MDVIEGVRGHLLAETSIASLVTARVYTPRLPERLTLPAVQLTLVSDVDDHHLRGPNGQPTSRVQVDAWAQTRDQAWALGRKCRQRLNGYQGVWVDASSPQNSLHVKAIFYDSGSERFEEDIHGGLCRHSADYRLMYHDPDDEVLI